MNFEKLTSLVSDSPQHLLVTLFGDFWLDQPGALPSTSIVRILTQFGITEVNARAALSRLSRKKILRNIRRGRRTAYALTDLGHQILMDGTFRIFAFQVRGRSWDGRWTLVAFSVPEEKRSVRSKLRTRLSWLGFVAILDAVWIAPTDLRDEVDALIDEMGVLASAVVYGSLSGDIASNFYEALHLNRLREKYLSFINDFFLDDEAFPILMEDPNRAFILRAVVMDQWRLFPSLDPELPLDLLPDGWPAAQAQLIFSRIYDSLGPPALLRFQELVSVDDEAAAQVAHFHTSSDFLPQCVGSDDDQRSH